MIDSKSKSSILIVDDDVNVQEMLKECLLEAGYNATSVGSAITALNAIEKHHFNLLIIDIMMPDIDGISLCRSVRKIKDYERVPIIILTALSDAETMQEAMLYGAVDYIVKPFDVQALREKIQVAIHRSRQKKPL